MRTGLILYQADLTLIAIITILIKILITANMIYLKRGREVHPNKIPLIVLLTINSVLIQIQNDISINIIIHSLKY